MKTNSPVTLFLSALSGIGGIQRYNQSLLSSLKKLNISHKVFILNDRERPENGEAFNRNKWQFLWNAFMRRNECSIVFIGHVNLLPVLFLLKSATRSILVIHGIDVWKPLKKIEVLALRMVSIVWSVSSYSAARFRELNPSYLGQIRLVPNQLPPSFSVHKSEKATNTTRILTVTRLVSGDKREKHVPELISAIKKICLSGITVRYDLVTSGDDVAWHRAMIENDPVLSGICQVHMNVSDDDLKKLYGHAHWFILPSKKEGFGIVFLEAMANHCICIGGNAGGTPDVIQHGVNGFLVDFNQELIDEQIVKIILRNTDSEKLKTVILEAEKTITRFSHHSVTNLIEMELDYLASLKD